MALAPRPRPHAIYAWALAHVRDRQRALLTKYRAGRDECEQAALIYVAHAKRVLADKKLSSEAKQARGSQAKKTGPGDYPSPCEWWRWRESNSRPETLHSRDYMLSQVIVLLSPNR